MHCLLASTAIAAFLNVFKLHDRRDPGCIGTAAAFAILVSLVTALKFKTN